MQPEQSRRQAIIMTGTEISGSKNRKEQKKKVSKVLVLQNNQ